jgi:hypothetical protein
MQVEKRPREWYTARREGASGDPGRHRIVLIAGSYADAAPHLENLRNAGFNVEFRTNTPSPAEMRQHTRGVRLIVLLESETMAWPRVADILPGASPGLPCVLLPAGASAEQSEVAVRTAMRWTSVAHVSASAAGG